MTRHPFLESFSRSLGPTLKDAQEQERLESIRAEAYEAGYASGWDDAIASDKTSRLRLEAEFERNIQNLAFTFAEAVAHVRDELRTFLGAIVDQFFPAIIPASLCEHVRDELLRVGEEISDVPVEIVTSRDCNEVIADMLRSDFSIDINLVEDSSLTSGQVYVKLGSRETEIDLSALLDAVSTQLKALDDTHAKEDV